MGLLYSLINGDYSHMHHTPPVFETFLYNTENPYVSESSDPEVPSEEEIKEKEKIEKERLQKYYDDFYYDDFFF